MPTESSIDAPYMVDNLQEVAYHDIIRNAWATATITALTAKKYVSSFFPSLLIQFDSTAAITYLFGEKTWVFTAPYPESSQGPIVPSNSPNQPQPHQKSADTKPPLAPDDAVSYLTSFTACKNALRWIHGAANMGTNDTQPASFPQPNEYFLLIGVIGRTYYLEIVNKPVFESFQRYLTVFYVQGFDWVLVWGKTLQHGFKNPQSLYYAKNFLEQKLQPQSYPDFEKQCYSLQFAPLAPDFLTSLHAQIESELQLALVYEYDRTQWAVNDISRAVAQEQCKSLKKRKKYYWLVGKPVYVQGRVILFEQDGDMMLLDVNDLMGREYVTHEL